MSRVLGSLFLLALLWAGASALQAQARLQAPRLLDVRVWYYASGTQDPPVSLAWWQPDGNRLERQVELSRQGLLRVRALVSGGIDEDDSGTLNWLSIVFRDKSGAQYELPVERRETRSGVKDLYWRVPQGFPSGPLEVEVLAWGERGTGPARSSTPADRSAWLKLGHVVD